MADKESRAKSAMSSGKKKSSKKKSKKGGKKPHRMHIRRAANGGYVAEHEFQPGADGVSQPSEEHVLPDLASLQDHVGEHMAPEEAAAPQQPQQPAPMMG